MPRVHIATHQSTSLIPSVRPTSWFCLVLMLFSSLEMVSLNHSLLATCISSTLPDMALPSNAVRSPCHVSACFPRNSWASSAATAPSVEFATFYISLSLTVIWDCVTTFLLETAVFFKVIQQNVLVISLKFWKSLRWKVSGPSQVRMEARMTTRLNSVSPWVYWTPNTSGPSPRTWRPSTLEIHGCCLHVSHLGGATQEVQCCLG